MPDNERYMLSLVEKLSFVRYGGTDDELRAANILLQELSAAGGQGSLMDFSVPAFDAPKCGLSIIEPYKKDVTAVPFGLGGLLDNAKLELYYAENGEKENFIGVDDLSNHAVLLNSLTEDAYKLLCEKHAAAFIAISGKYYNDFSSSSIYLRNLRPHFLRHGKIPGCEICAADATALVSDGAKRVRLRIAGVEGEHTSRNVLATVNGTQFPKESIVLTAHYDSVPLGTGSWDNATGAAALMWLYRHFVKNPPKRTMRFVWCGSEEQGLLGSKAYVEANEELIKDIKFCFNFDMCGTILGGNDIFVTGDDKLETFARQFCREEGYAAKFRVCVHSSDSAPFCDKGIPALGVSRGTNSAEIHTIHDLLPTLGQRQLYENGQFAIKLVSRVANSAMLPVDTGMPDDIKKELDKYFHRDNKDDKKEEK